MSTGCRRLDPRGGFDGVACEQLCGTSRVETGHVPHYTSPVYQGVR